MTLAAIRPKTIVVGVSDSGHRVAEDHPNHNPDNIIEHYHQVKVHYDIF